MSNGRVVIIGAGPAGLACAAELGRKGIRSTVLEQGSAIGTAWRGRYDRLRLNSSRWFSKLPGGRYADGTGIFPSRDEMVGYLEAYAERHRIDVRLRTRLERIDRDAGGWLVRTSDGDLGAEQVIVATGHAHSPFIPDWPGRDRFEGPLMHVAEYRNAEPFRGADVLVVGSGCSGMEIAYDLAQGGAARVRVAVRTSPNIMIRTPMGPGIARVVLRLGKDRADRIIRAVSRREVGDLSEYGLPVPEEGVASRLHRLGVAPAIVDHDIVEAIKARRIEIVAGVYSLDANTVTLTDRMRIEPDAVIAATGYRRGLEPVVGHLDVLDERGNPRAVAGAPAAPGLRFIGYVPWPAMIGVMGREARTAAKAIARELKTSPVARQVAMAPA
jgi:cation diffusion facilitator CzcD-associated flavoprotein CzcO